jgi:hypothetical protein
MTRFSILAAIAVASCAAVCADDKIDLIKKQTSPIKIANIQGYELPLCNKVYSNEDHWKTWSDCSARCGEGVKFSYMSNKGKSQATDKKCEITYRTQTCIGTTCPQDCMVSEWAAYGKCDQVSGKKLRTRTVKVPVLFDGKKCPALEEDANCAVDCQLSEYTPYAECVKSTGLSKRTRTVVHPDLNGGKTCALLEDFKDCDVHCEEGKWGVYTTCNKEDGTKSRTRPIVVSSKNGGTKCVTSEIADCVVNCEVGVYSAWSGCDKPTGSQFRTREVTVTSKNGGTACDEPVHDTNLLETRKCRVDCEVSPWETWGECRKATGIQKRERETTVNPKNNGTECPALDDYKDCTVHCEATEWGKYGKCNKTDGVKWR